jgi:hypothetical protein
MRTTALVVSLVISTGCFGRTKEAKTTAYVANGFALAVGAAILISAQDASSSACDGCFDLGPSDHTIQSTLGALFAIPAVIGLILNVATPYEPTIAPPPSAPARHAAATMQVTGPGLEPATIELD